MRPTYESPEDLFAEEEIATAFAKLWECEMFGMPTFSPVDRGVIHDGALVAWVEIKRRRRERERHPSLILSLTKATAGVQIAELTKTKFLFIVQFDDCYAWTEIQRQHLDQTVTVGRTDRQDPADIELCVEIPNDRLRVVEATSP